MIFSHHVHTHTHTHTMEKRLMNKLAFLLMTMYASRAVSSNRLNKSDPYQAEREGEGEGIYPGSKGATCEYLPSFP